MSKSSSNDKSPRRPSRRGTSRKKATAKAKITAPSVKIKKSGRPRGASAILGLGLDNTDGHKRVTTAEQFAILGGSAETHDRMTETLVKTFEELKHRGKHLSQVERTELAEIIHKSTPR